MKTKIYMGNNMNISLHVSFEMIALLMKALDIYE